jgi:hypothetical protein
MSGYLPSYSQLVTGAANTTGATTVTLIPAPDMGAICVSSLQLGRTDAGATSITVTLSDVSSTVLVVPPVANGGGVRDVVFDAPLLLANKAALTFQASAGVSTLYASAQGFLKN